MIYIDPPYNTKNEDFIYPDNFREDYKKILIETGLLSFSEDGEEISSDTLKFFRNITGTRSHSGWLSFMLPRLKLARDLLREDGVIFISIDDNEQANLKLLCDEIFGEENFVGDFIWHNKYTTSNDTDVSYQHEHILCYSKQREIFSIGLLPRTYKQDKDYKNRDNDPKGLWKATPIHARSGSVKSIYKIIFPNGIEWEAPSGRYPRYSKEKLLELYNKNELYFNSNGGVDKKTYLSEVRQGVTCGTVWSYEEVGHSHGNNEELSEILKKGLFSDPKGTKLLRKILQISTSPNDIILDFFAGSGTTAQAVMELNAEDGGNREFILVQIDQEIDKDKNKNSYDFCKNELGSQVPVISDITIERVNRAGEKIKNTFKQDLTKSNQDLDIGYKVYSLCDKPSIISDEMGGFKLISSRDKLSSFDIARNLALNSGKILSLPLEEIIKDKLYFCEDCYYLLAIDEQVKTKLETIKDFEIYIDGYSDIDLENFLNLGVVNKDQINVIY